MERERFDNLPFIYNEEELENVVTYPRPRATVDMVVFSEHQYILLQKRNIEPYKGMWCLPGGHIEKGEDYRDSASRELKEEMSLDINPLRWDLSDVYTTTYLYGKEIDPRGWRISVAVYVMTKQSNVIINNESSDYIWLPIEELSDTELAFNHNEIINNTFKRIMRNVK